MEQELVYGNRHWSLAGLSRIRPNLLREVGISNGIPLFQVATEVNYPSVLFVPKGDGAYYLYRCTLRAA